MVRATSSADSRYPLQADVERVLLADAAGPTDPAAADREAQAVAVRILGEARALLLNAGALRDLSTRFTPEQSAGMAEGSRAVWRALVNGHARDTERAAAILAASLEPWLADDNETATAPPEASTDSTAAAVERLFTQSVTIDQAVREAFAASAVPPAVLRLSTVEFRRTLADAQATAGQIQVSNNAIER
jgi:hypothetical protein